MARAGGDELAVDLVVEGKIAAAAALTAPLQGRVGGGAGRVRALSRARAAGLERVAVGDAGDVPRDLRSAGLRQLLLLTAAGQVDGVGLCARTLGRGSLLLLLQISLLVAVLLLFLGLSVEGAAPLGVCARVG